MESTVDLRRMRRKQRDMTLADLAKRVGLSTGQVSRIEREGTSSLPVAIKLSEALNLPVESFVKQ
jgi:transcriptional regulator with XRE-family HTH domain